MEPMKLRVFAATFSYGGNGGLKSEHPDVGRWLTKTVMECSRDPRIAGFVHEDLADTPITMTRNRAVLRARQMQADVLLMVDSDMGPDYLVGTDPTAKPFFRSSFDFLYERLKHGKETCIFAPYCGPSPNQMPYPMRWRNISSGKPEDYPDLQLDLYTREEAAVMQGIHQAAAGPTGLIMFSMGCFKWGEPRTPTDNHETLAQFKAGLIPEDEALRRILQRSWFYYDFDIYGAEKHSTEDVTATRDISLLGLRYTRENPLFCNWDSWARHWKPEGVGKPVMLTPDKVGQKYLDAVRMPNSDVRLVDVDFTDNLPESPQRNGHIDREQLREALESIST